MKNYKKGRTEVEGRVFQIEFWNDDHFGLPYVRVSEITLEEGKAHWFSRKLKIREVEHCVGYGWMDGNRLEWAMDKIAAYLQEEKEVAEEHRQIEGFCNNVKTELAGFADYLTGAHDG